MDQLQKYVFRSRPPVITLGGFRPPSVQVQPRSVQPPLPPKENEILNELKNMSPYVKCSKDNFFTVQSNFPSAIVPHQLGNTQIRFLHKPEIAQISADRRVEASQQIDKKQQAQKEWLVSDLKKSKPPISRPSTAMTSPRRRRLSQTPSQALIRVNRTPQTNKTKLTWFAKDNQLKLEPRRVSLTKIDSSLSQFTHELEEPIVESKLRINCYKGEYAYGKRNGRGRITYENGDSYNGEWKDNLRHGQGKFIYSNHVKYIGAWDMGRKHGTGMTKFQNGDNISSEWKKDNMIATEHGRVNFANGTVYQGSIQDGERSGQGVQRYENGWAYSGSWRADCRDGYGVLTFWNDCFFEGQFLHDRTGGVGALVFKNRLTTSQTMSIPIVDKRAYFRKIDEKLERFSLYTVKSKDIVWITKNASEMARIFPDSWKELENGNFRNGKLYGCGVAVYGTFGFYVGNFVDGQRSGLGRMKYKDLERFCEGLQEVDATYTGQWSNDERHGYGEIKWWNKYKYFGHYRHDIRHRVKGKMMFGKKEWYDGEWSDNLMDGEGVYHYNDGNIFRGRFSEGHQANVGIVEYKDGPIYEGEFKHLIPHGRGKMIYKDRSTYEGDFRKNKRQGRGTYHWPNGDVYTGDWKEDTKDGYGTMAYKFTGEVYDGEWTCDKRDGFGTLTNKKRETMYKGQWRNDHKDGPGKIAHTTTPKDPRFYERSS